MTDTRNVSRVLCEVIICLIPGSRPGGKEESRTGEDQEPEEEVQRADPEGSRQEEIQEQKYEEKDKTRNRLTLVRFDLLLLCNTKYL